MGRFKPGQKVVCVNKSIPWLDEDGVHHKSPSYNEIVTVEYTVMDPKYRCNYIALCGYPQEYREDQFEPLMDISELNEVLSSIPEPFTV